MRQECRGGNCHTAALCHASDSPSRVVSSLAFSGRRSTRCLIPGRILQFKRSKHARPQNRSWFSESNLTTAGRLRSSKYTVLILGIPNGYESSEASSKRVPTHHNSIIEQGRCNNGPHHSASDLAWPYAQTYLIAATLLPCFNIEYGPVHNLPGASAGSACEFGQHDKLRVE